MSGRGFGSKSLPDFHRASRVLKFLAVSCAAFLASLPAFAGDGVIFSDIAAEGDGLSSGLAYERTGSETAAIWDLFIQEPTVFSFFDIATMPFKWRGAPGVALLDHDRDGDLDIYVTNGPGTDNSLFSNQLVETGELRFVDVAVAAGAGLRDHDSSGVCFGDTDNDGDPDLLVLSNHDSNRFLENNGRGSGGAVTFTDLSATSGLSVEVESSMSCTFGDVNGDGLLDVAVANSYLDMSNTLGIVGDPFAFNLPNDLYLNVGGNQFVDVSESSGIRDLKGFPPGFDGSPSITWAIAMVDYDLDGDIDIFHADDQASTRPAVYGGLDRGFIHVLRNDGTGQFTDVTVESNMNHTGGWMGLSFGDVNADGHLDVFGTNVGDWSQTTLTPLDPVYADFGVYELGLYSSRWFLGGDGGVFSDPGVGGLVATPFGWGTSMADYDNDSDTDIIFYGGMAFGPVTHNENFGSYLNNDGSGGFSYDVSAIAGSTDHRYRNVEGMAVGDLDDDGFPDVVSVASSRVPASNPQSFYNNSWSSPIDDLLFYQRTCDPTTTPPGLFVCGVLDDFENGSLSVEINSGNNGNRWVKVGLVGGAGLTSQGRANRDGIGAVVTFTTRSGKSTMRPVTGGSSYASQDSLELSFGLGSERRGTVEVLWPGGSRNRLYGARRSERVTFPEIPCSFDAEWPSFFAYKQCVAESLREMDEAGVIGGIERVRFLISAIRAYFDAR